ncbi:MAG: glycosyltransferase family 39 protein, partial [candidate division KSB1 bacterium]|nr:glycosyltransferase family 39 protein [candidate division KSB1 bacterium]
YYAAQSMLETGKPSFPSGEANPRAALYSKLVAYSFQFLGANEFSLRLPSAVLGVHCIVVAFFVAQRFFGTTTALLTALFLAISPFAIGWSRLSRMYTLFQFLFVWGIYAFYRGFENDGKGMFARWQESSLSKLKAVRDFLNRWQLNVFWLWSALVFFVLSYSVHDLTALFAVGLAFYLAGMFLLHWKDDGLFRAVRGKYFITLVGLVSIVTFAIVARPEVRSMVTYALTYIPKWAEGTRFQDRKLFFDFMFDHYNFPMGVLFVIGAYQIVARLHRQGIYLLSIFLGYLFMFTVVFSYRHFQYLYNVYALFVMISAFAFSNIVGHETEWIKQNWFSKTRLSNALLKGLVLFSFLAWLPLTPSVRLARRIPLSEDGSFNGAMYMEEWREACEFVRAKSDKNDLIISSDALGTLHYLGRVDYDLNFADLDIAIEKGLKRADGEYFDLYSGKPFIQSLAQLQRLTEEHENIWLLSQHYKFLEAAAFVPINIRDYVLAHFERVLTTPNGTVLVFRFSADKYTARPPASATPTNGGS